MFRLFVILVILLVAISPVAAAPVFQYDTPLVTAPVIQDDNDDDSDDDDDGGSDDADDNDDGGDSGSNDSGSNDSGSNDSGSNDSGSNDSGSNDSGSNDANDNDDSGSEDGRVGSLVSPTAIFLLDDEIDIYLVDAEGTGTLLFRLFEDDFPDEVSENTLIEVDENVAIYLLTSGEVQVNAVRDGELFEVIFFPPWYSGDVDDSSSADVPVDDSSSADVSVDDNDDDSDDDSSADDVSVDDNEDADDNDNSDDADDDDDMS